jgi:hypothetical protein
VYRSTSLCPSHYAGKWLIPSDEQLNDLSEVNQLGLEYAKMEDCPEKEDKLLKIIEMFHGYLMKYLTMIVRGTLPPLNSSGGKEAKTMLTLLIDRETPVNKDTLNAACKMLHLSFKGATTEEIYDTLVACFIRAARKYDPYYTDKMESVCGVINGLGKQFSKEQLNARMGFDCSGLLRVLVRKGYVASIEGKRKAIIGYTRAGTWPPPKEFFQSGPIGFVYVLSRWFRWYVREYIVDKRNELESQEGVLQLDHCRPNYARLGEQAYPDTYNVQEFGLPHVDGNIMTIYGNRVMADTTLIALPLDLHQMNLEWVASTDDKLFRKLSRRERLLLYLVYVEEKTWKQIGKTLDCDVATVHRRLEEVLKYLVMRTTKCTAQVAQVRAAEIVTALTNDRMKKKKKPKQVLQAIA